MRTKLVVGNWKMNLSPASATALVDTFLGHVETRSDVDVAVCPSYTLLSRVKDVVRNTHVKVGAQDVFWEEKGAFTGQISAQMLYDLCIDYCIVGHSETRGRFGKLEVPDTTLGYFSESEVTINLKIKSLIFHSINPILCVGETLAEREAGQTDSVIRTQLEGALRGIEPVQLYLFSVAYEPVWAIGTGQTCASDEAGRVCAMIRNILAELLSPEVAEEVRILYGGSVKASNSADLFAQPSIDGGLVGGASLDAVEFAQIVKSAPRS